MPLPSKIAVGLVEEAAVVCSAFSVERDTTPTQVYIACPFLPSRSRGAVTPAKGHFMEEKLWASPAPTRHSPSKSLIAGARRAQCRPQPPPGHFPPRGGWEEEEEEDCRSPRKSHISSLLFSIFSSSVPFHKTMRRTVQLPTHGQRAFFLPRRIIWQG